MPTKREFLAGIGAGALLAGLCPLRAAAQAPGLKPGGDGAGTAPVADPYPDGYQIHAPAVPAGEPTIVQVRQGRLQGVKAGPVRYFRGIPFAQPPVGALRFKAPEPAKAWRGTRLAVENPPAPLQPNELLEARTSEDCLYLNIWAPDSPGPHPVYVYIHGGGNSSGYSLEYRVQGASFARDGIVCVNIAYRVGVLGFLELEGLLGAGYAGSGNNAMRDQLLAIQWVRDNIAAFGGDPGRVTIGGQSAGAFDVCNLVASPLTAGLFKGAISQSGGGHKCTTREEALHVGDLYAQVLKSRGLEPGVLPRMAADDILNAQLVLQGTSGWSGVFSSFVDGHLLPERPNAAGRRGVNAGVSILLGSNHDEMAVLGGGKARSSLSATQAVAYERFASLQGYAREKVQTMRFATEEMFGGPSALLADSCSSGGHKVYLYRWNWPAPTGRFQGAAFHGIEQSFAWDNVRALAGRYVLPDPSFQARADTIHELWCQFIRTGVPAAAQVPEWQAWTPARRQYLSIHDGYSIESYPQEYLDLWVGLLGT